MITITPRALLALVVPAMVLAPSAGLAQAAPASAAPASSAQCLSSTFLDATGTAQPLTIYVLPSEAGTYTAKGFVAGACGATSLTAYRWEACRVARLGNNAVQSRLTKVLGVSPKDLCDSANRAAAASASMTTGN